MTIQRLVVEKKFRIFLDLVAADQAGVGPLGEGTRNDTAQSDEWREEEYDDDVLERAAMGLGQCVGDDVIIPAQFYRMRRDNQHPTLGLRKTCAVLAPQFLDSCFITSSTYGKPETYEGVMAHEVLQVMPGRRLAW